MPSELYKRDTFFTLSGASLGVWLFTTVLAEAFEIDIQKYKWIGVLVALVISYIGAMRIKKFDIEIWTIAFFNGLLIYVTATGIASINAGADVKSRQEASGASLIPLSNGYGWWPPTKLIDSVIYMTQVQDEQERLIAKLRTEHADTSPLAIVINPQSTTVPAGSKYRADVVISSGIEENPEVMLNGRKLPIEDTSNGDRFAIVEFAATGGGYKGQTQRKTAILEFKWPTGKTQSIPLNYEVFKPSIKVASVRQQIAYLNALNSIKISVDGITPTFHANNGDIINVGEGGRVDFVPKNKGFSIDVLDNEMILGTEVFGIRTMPMPTVAIVDSNGIPFNARDGIPLNKLGMLKIRLTADPDFSETAPRDARYNVKFGKLYLRKGTALGVPISITSNTVDVSSFTDAREGDVLSFELLEIARIRYDGSEDKFNPPVYVKYISIPISKPIN